MLGSEAVDLMKRRLGFRRNLDAECLFELREAQKRAEDVSRTQPWFLLQHNATIVTTADVATVALPDDFIKETDTSTSLLRYTPLLDDSLIPVKTLTKADSPELVAYYTETGGTVLTGGPRSYVLEKTQFRFYPTPDDVYTLYWDYHAKDDPIALDEENEWLKYASDYIIGDAGIRLARDIRNADAAATFLQMFNEGQKQVIAGTVERELAGRELRMGSK